MCGRRMDTSVTHPQVGEKKKKEKTKRKRKKKERKKKVKKKISAIERQDTKKGIICILLHSILYI